MKDKSREFVPCTPAGPWAIAIRALDLAERAAAGQAVDVRELRLLREAATVCIECGQRFCRVCRDHWHACPCPGPGKEAAVAKMAADRATVFRACTDALDRNEHWADFIDPLRSDGTTIYAYETGCDTPYEYDPSSPSCTWTGRRAMGIDPGLPWPGAPHPPPWEVDAEAILKRRAKFDAMTKDERKACRASPDPPPMGQGSAQMYLLEIEEPDEDGRRVETLYVMDEEKT